MKSLTFESSYKSLSVNTMETKVWFAGYSSVTIIWLDSNNGAVISSNQM